MDTVSSNRRHGSGRQNMIEEVVFMQWMKTRVGHSDTH